MSLDVYLLKPKYTPEVQAEIEAAIKVLEWHEIELPYIAVTYELFWSNITHNLARMADDAGIYKQLWHPEEVGATKAAQLIGPLRTGLALLLSDEERFEKFNPENGWGDYHGLLVFVSEYLAACEEHPDADVSAW